MLSKWQHLIRQYATHGIALGVGIVLLIIAGTDGVSRMIPSLRYHNKHSQIQQLIHGVQNRCPEGVSQQLWHDGVGWTSTAFGNICLKDRTSYDEMLRFEHDLKDRLQKPLDLSYIDWFWGRISAVSPAGQQYVFSFRSRWDEIKASNNLP